MNYSKLFCFLFLSFPFATKSFTTRSNEKNLKMKTDHQITVHLAFIAKTEEQPQTFLFNSTGIVLVKHLVPKIGIINFISNCEELTDKNNSLQNSMLLTPIRCLQQNYVQVSILLMPKILIAYKDPMDDIIDKDSEGLNMMLEKGLTSSLILMNGILDKSLFKSNKVLVKITEDNLIDKTTSTQKYPLHIASIVFVSVSFMILVLVSLTWLGFYYIQRFRLSQYEYNGRRRHFLAVQKMIDLIPSRILKNNDNLLTLKRSCAICIDMFIHSEIIRELPCKHCFHKSCVDPWLLSKHTCPLCKYDIVTTLPKIVKANRFSVSTFENPSQSSGDPINS